VHADVHLRCKSGKCGELAEFEYDRNKRGDDSQDFPEGRQRAMRRFIQVTVEVLRSRYELS
jgi:hypothetical protein